MHRLVTLLRRASTLAYGVLCYLAALFTLVYAVGFFTAPWMGGRLAEPAAGSAPGSRAAAVAVDALLLATFALQHSVMARRGFKRRWTRFVPEPVERSTFVLASSLCLALLFWQWRPLGGPRVWDAAGTSLAPALAGVSLAGWLLVLASTFQLDHLELFGLRQVWNAFLGRRATPGPFATPPLYRAVRHPLYLGFLVAFWAAPTMTLGRLLFAAGMTCYVLLAIPLEERDLVRAFGERYRLYRRSTPMLLPWRLVRRARSRHLLQRPASTNE